MSASNTMENDLLKMICQGTDPTWRASATGYWALFTDDPTESGSLANECNYTSYARVAQTKATAWTDGGSTFSNAVCGAASLKSRTAHSWACSARALPDRSHLRRWSAP